MNRVTETKRMISLCEEGLSATAIAQALGMTRNTVMGRLRRAGHQCHSDSKHNSRSPALRPPKPSRRKQSRNYNVKGGSMDRAAPLAIVVSAPPKELLPAHDADGNLLTIETVSYRQCRWPYGEGAELHFCGHETPVGTSWCPFHETRVWQPGAAAKRRAAAIAKDVNTELARAA